MNFPRRIAVGSLFSGLGTVSTHTPYITTTAHRHEISLSLTRNLVEFSHQHCAHVPGKYFSFSPCSDVGSQQLQMLGAARMMSTLELLWNIIHFMNESVRDSDKNVCFCSTAILFSLHYLSAAGRVASECVICIFTGWCRPGAVTGKVI